jgi:hypothetical protein
MSLYADELVIGGNQGVVKMGQAKNRKAEIEALKARKAQAKVNSIMQQAARMNGIPGMDVPKDVLEALGDILLTYKDARIVVTIR